MSDIEKIVLGAALTILSGVLVYIAGQLLSKLFIDPLQSLRKTIGETRFNLAFYSGELHTQAGRTPEESDKARDALLRNSCDLLANLQTVSFYGVASTLRMAPCVRSIEDAAVQLRGLSTYLHETGSKAGDQLDVIAKRIKRVETLLGLKSIG